MNYESPAIDGDEFLNQRIPGFKAGEIVDDLRLPPTKPDGLKLNTNDLGGKVVNFTKYNFRDNLIKATGVDPGKAAQAHHVFPQKFAERFAEKGINIHDPKFGTWWETTSHLKNASAYNTTWNNFLRTNPSSSQILDFGRRLMLQYGIQPGF